VTTDDATFDFGGLYRRHAPDLHRYALFLSGDRAAAEDLVSETFVRVWGARERVELTTVRAYLLAIVRNLYLQGLRRARREEPLDPVVAGAAAPADPAPPADAAHAAAAELDHVLAALARLPEIDRTALLLRVDEDLSYEEIAAILGIAVVAARVKVHRARARLAAAREESSR